MPVLRLDSETGSFLVIVIQRLAVVVPDPELLGMVEIAALGEHVEGDEDLVEEVCAYSNSSGSCTAYSSKHDFVLEGSKDDEAELNIDVDNASTMAYKTL